MPLPARHKHIDFKEEERNSSYRSERIQCLPMELSLPDTDFQPGLWHCSHSSERAHSSVMLLALPGKQEEPQVKGPCQRL